jgi:hypothetical protein
MATDHGGNIMVEELLTSWQLRSKRDLGREWIPIASLKGTPE